MNTLLRHTLHGVSALLVIALLVACDRGTPEPSAEAEPESGEAAERAEESDLQRAVRSAAAIRTAAHTDPASLPRVMQEHGVTPAALEQMLYEIAADREAALEYERLTGQAPQ